jgi:hypothetical protein
MLRQNRLRGWSANSGLSSSTGSSIMIMAIRCVLGMSAGSDQ